MLWSDDTPWDLGAPSLDRQPGLPFGVGVSVPSAATTGGAESKAHKSGIEDPAGSTGILRSGIEETALPDELLQDPDGNLPKSKLRVPGGMCSFGWGFPF